MKSSGNIVLMLTISIYTYINKLDADKKSQLKRFSSYPYKMILFPYHDWIDDSDIISSPQIGYLEFLQILKDIKIEQFTFSIMSNVQNGYNFSIRKDNLTEDDINRIGIELVTNYDHLPWEKKKHVHVSSDVKLHDLNLIAPYLKQLGATPHSTSINTIIDHVPLTIVSTI